MPFSPALMIIGANAIRAAAVKAKIHTANPGTGGTANPTTAATVAFTWGTAANDGDFDIAAAINFTGGAAGGPAQWVSIWDTTAAIWYGNFQLTGDQTFNSSGQYSVTSLAQNGSAT